MSSHTIDRLFILLCVTILAGFILVTGWMFHDVKASLGRFDQRIQHLEQSSKDNQDRLIKSIEYSREK
jgi:hypothetical protein